MFGLVLYASEYIHKGEKDILSIPKVGFCNFVKFKVYMGN